MHMNKTQQYIAGAPLHPGPAKCSAIDCIAASFRTSAYEGEIEIVQTAFDSFTVQVEACAVYNPYASACGENEEHYPFSRATSVKGEDVADTLIVLLEETCLIPLHALRNAKCIEGEASHWETLCGVMIERLEAEERTRENKRFERMGLEEAEINF